MSRRVVRQLIPLLLFSPLMLADVSPVSVATTSLPDAVLKQSYSATLNANGPNARFTWTESGSFRPGLAFSSNGRITGSPSSIGTFPFTVTATNTRNQAGSALLSISVASTINIQPTSLPDGQVAVAYSQTLQATGGKSPYQWSLASGALPAGLALSSGGQISGTPTASGTANFTIKATDSNAASGTQALSINVTAAPVTITTVSPPDGQVGTAYGQSLQASGGRPPDTWSITSAALPARLALSSSG